MIDYNLIIITAVSVVIPIFAQQELSRRNIKSDLTEKIKNAVTRDARERKKIYKKLCDLENKSCDLEKKVDKLLK